MSIVKDIINKNKIKKMKSNLEEVVMDDFYIPDANILQKVDNRQPLTKDEINQYLNYIYFNYFLPKRSEDAICIFGGDWCKYDSDLENLKKREEEAKTILAHQLANGEVIDTTYALWFSRNIYVDNENEALKRVIRKDNQGRFTVYTATKYFNISKAVDKLHRELIDKTLSKDVANNL